MKIQNMAIIFAIIIIPITLILSAYIQIQIDTASIQQQYSTHLMGATHDAIIAFQSNTINNKYSTNADSIRRDISAAINTFSTSLSSSIGTNANNVMSYVPALVFTLYDGYYIYSPVEYINDDGTTSYKHILKPYVHYSARYVQDDNNYVVVNYSLDNYISVYGYVKGKYINKSGYLIDLDRIVRDGDEVIGYKITDSFTINTNVLDNISEYEENKTEPTTMTSSSAKKYYKEAYEFTNWLLKDVKLQEIVKPNNAVKSDGTKYSEFINNNTKILDVSSRTNSIESKESIFNEHKREVMKISIQDNLNNAIATYSNHSINSFAMPKLTETDWDKILTNVNMISFMQGIQVGTKVFNDYSIVTSTRNKQYVNPNSIYFVDNGTYHRINCEDLGNNNIVGYASINFSKYMTSNDRTKYYYKHKETACYKCIVNSLSEDIDISSLSNEKKQAYYIALAREKYNLYKFGIN